MIRYKYYCNKCNAYHPESSECQLKLDKFGEEE